MALYKNLLLVEDDKDDQMLFVDILREIEPEVNVTLADNGQYALELVRVAEPLKPDLIFLDLNMPVMNGFDFMAVINSTKEYKDIPLIVLTTSSNAYQQCYDLGANLYLEKPQTLQAYRDLMRKVLNSNVAGNFEQVRSLFLPAAT